MGFAGLLGKFSEGDIPLPDFPGRDSVAFGLKKPCNVVWPGATLPLPSFVLAADRLRLNDLLVVDSVGSAGRLGIVFCLNRREPDGSTAVPLN